MLSEQRRRARPGLLNQLSDAPVFGGGRGARVHHEQDHVGIAQRVYSYLDHESAQRRARVMNTWRVHKDDLLVRLGEDAQLAQAGGLRLGADNGELLAEDGVHQRGLAHVGPPDDGDEAALCPSGNSSGAGIWASRSSGS